MHTHPYNIITPPFEALLGVEQAGKVLGFHPETVREMARQGLLPGRKIGKYWKFRISDLEKWINSQ